jgi:hypothetical protein
MSFDPEKVRSLLDHVELVTTSGSRGPVGWVYFIICMDAERCKIGFTKGDVHKRLKSLQTGSASELILIAKHPGTPETERALHDKFAHLRLRGEWFDLTDELRAYLVSALWAMSEITLRAGHKLEPWMAAGIQLTAEKLGCISEGLEEAMALA